MRKFRFLVIAVDGEFYFECDTQEEFTNQFGILEQGFGYAVTSDGVNTVRPQNRESCDNFERFCSGKPIECNYCDHVWKERGDERTANFSITCIHCGTDGLI